MRPVEGTAVRGRPRVPQQGGSDHWPVQNGSMTMTAALSAMSETLAPQA
jgi:hypothetical protein